MAVRSSEAEWKGNLRNGQGTMKLGSGAFQGSYTFVSRFEAGKGTNPEELIAAAHAGCFSMALSAGLSSAGFTPTRVHTTARVHLEPVGQGFGITKIELQTEAEIPGIDEPTFQKEAENAKKNCPVSKALARRCDVRTKYVSHRASRAALHLGLFEQPGVRRVLRQPASRSA